MLNIAQLLTGDLNRVRYVQRYSTSLSVHKENVAEHSFFVAWYALVLGREVQRSSAHRIDMEKLLTRAVLHDIDEALSGDFSRPFKYSSDQLLALLHAASKTHLQKSLEKTVDSLEVRPILNMWDNSKDSSLEGRLIQFCDYLAVVSHLYFETAFKNPSMTSHMDTMMEYSGIFDNPDFDFIRPYVQEAQALVASMFEGGSNA